MCIATHHAAVRLACVKHAASVQSEPGSNSPIQILGIVSNALESSVFPKLNAKLLK
jgi:hypothetical protein